MYQPAEDSLLLERHSEKLAKGSVLDMGTGIGIQALAAAKNNKVSKVLAADIDKEAVAYCKRNLKNNKIKIIKSDLFSDISGKFDTIIFNPPYLPEEKDIKTKKSSKDFRVSKTEDRFGIKDAALYGGEDGIEIIERFFLQAKKYLGKNGIILMVFSSITGKTKVNDIIKNSGFKFKEIGRQHIFFEDLYVYAIKER